MYMQYCAQNSCSDCDGRLVTRQRSVLMTESRLQLALSSGLTVTGWTFDSRCHAELICAHSLEPEKVMTLLIVYSVLWCTNLCNGATFCNKLALLQWLHAQSCPWAATAVLNCASARGSVAMLEWLLAMTPSWSSDAKQAMLAYAGCHSNLAAAQWLRAHGAVWPKSFTAEIAQAETKLTLCWDVSVVRWALACGSGWLAWRCADYAADNYEIYFEQQATELLEWAHANGCPCTCGHVQQQQQQQQQQ
jgi:hypothetical protein